MCNTTQEYFGRRSKNNNDNDNMKCLVVHSSFFNSLFSDKMALNSLNASPGRSSDISDKII